MGRRTLVAVLALACVAATLSAAGSRASARASSLPTVQSGARPGPSVLYEGPPEAPELENRSPRFKAEPLLVSGTDAYIRGEYLYQDYIYDDGGANTFTGPGGELDGDITYPTATGRYANNAADLVEFRVAPGRDDVAYRITLNTLLRRDSTIVAIAFDTDRFESTGSDLLPGDPGAPFPGTDEVVTAWGTGAVHARDSSSGWRLRKVRVTTDLEANQMMVVVPRSISNPRGAWRATVAVGLHNPADNSWLKPQMGQASADTPGGAGPTGAPGIFNLGFRFSEPVLEQSVPPDAAQAEALGAGEPTRFQRRIDFGALEKKVTRINVPRTGTMVRIFPSRLTTEGGKDFSATPQLRGRLQPYSLYVPKGYRRNRPAGLTLMLHSLGEHHWQYNGSIGVQQVGEQRDNIVLTTEARGANGWYVSEAEYDVFEAWNDVARHYSLDPDRTAVSGYSMGGYATYRLGSLWPDLFGKAFSTVGPPAEGIWAPPVPPTGSGRSGFGHESNTNVWLENTRNVPYLNVVGMLDELVPYTGTRAQNLGAPELGIRGFDQLGYRYRFVTYPTGEHFTIALLSYDTPYAVDFLGAARVNRNPDHVTFSYAPVTDDRKLGLVHDHAYWVSGVRLADGETGEVPKGTVDAFSHARGRGDPTPTDVIDAGTATLPYFVVGNDWGEAPRIRKENKLTLRLTNVRDVRVDLDRAGIDTGRTVLLDLHTDVTTTVRLVADGAGWVVRMPAGGRVFRLR